MGVKELSDALKNAVQKRIDKESRARRGIIQNGQFACGAKTYPYLQAVECNTSEGKKVWGQLSKNGNMVVVGA